MPFENVLLEIENRNNLKSLKALVKALSSRHVTYSPIYYPNTAHVLIVLQKPFYKAKSEDTA